MKFPNSAHAEGWLAHIEATGAGHAPSAALAGTDHRTRADDRLVFVDTDEAAPAAPEPARAAISPWVVGTGAAAALIALAVSMSHNLSPADALAPPQAMAGKVQPEPPPPASPQDAQLAAAPTAAGLTTPEPQAAPPTPAAQPAVTAAVAPAVKAAKAEPRPADAPVARTLSQAAAPPAMPLESSRPALLATAPVPQLPPSVAAPEATPATPPVAQAAAEPEDAGITIKVRTALSTDAVLAGVPIAVSTDHGVVKLEGQAPDAQARERATVVAAATTGVKGVDNRLTLPPVAGLGSVQPQG